MNKGFYSRRLWFLYFGLGVMGVALELYELVRYRRLGKW